MFLVRRVPHAELAGNQLYDPCCPCSYPLPLTVLLSTATTTNVSIDFNVKHLSEPPSPKVTEQSKDRPNSTVALDSAHQHPTISPTFGYSTVAPIGSGGGSATSSSSLWKAAAITGGSALVAVSLAGMLYRRQNKRKQWAADDPVDGKVITYDTTAEDGSESSFSPSAHAPFVTTMPTLEESQSFGTTEQIHERSFHGASSDNGSAVMSHNIYSMTSWRCRPARRNLLSPMPQEDDNDHVSTTCSVHSRPGQGSFDSEMAHIISDVEGGRQGISPLMARVHEASLGEEEIVFGSSSEKDSSQSDDSYHSDSDESIRSSQVGRELHGLYDDHPGTISDDEESASSRMRRQEEGLYEEVHSDSDGIEAILSPLRRLHSGDMSEQSNNTDVRENFVRSRLDDDEYLFSLKVPDLIKRFSPLG